jgi:hypothetical protein
MKTETITEPKNNTSHQIAADPRENWLTLEQAQKLESFLDKYFVKKDGSDSEFIYKVISIHPSVSNPFIIDNQRFQIIFNVQKFYRNQKVKNKVPSNLPPDLTDEKLDLVEREELKPVESHQEFNGQIVCVDPEAYFFMDSHEFQKKFSPA